MSAAPKPLQPLVSALPQLDTSTLTTALRAAALHLQGRDAEINASAVADSLDGCGVGGGGTPQILQACGWLLKQAGKGGGMSEEKMARTLSPFGFDASHIGALMTVLEWVRKGAPTGRGEGGAGEGDGSGSGSGGGGRGSEGRAGEPEPGAGAAGGGGSTSEGDGVEEGEAPDPAEILHWSAVAGERDKLAQVVGHPEVELDGTDERGYSAYRLRKAAHPPTHILGLTAGPLPDPCRRVFAASVIAARTSRYHHACGNGHADCVRVLLDAGCDTSKRNVVGLTGWALAARLKKASVTALLEEHAADGHVALAAEKYVVEVWGGSKRLAVTHRRYSEFHDLRRGLLESLGSESEDRAKVEALPWAKKTILGKNSSKVRDKRCTTLEQWLNATLLIVGKSSELCKFLGLSPEFIGITIVKDKAIEAYTFLYEVKPMGAAKGLTTVDLPRRILMGIDTNGVQLFDAATKVLIDGENYPYHLIRSWSWHQPSDDTWNVVLTFGEDQKGFKLRLATDQGKDICGRMRDFATSLAVDLRKQGLEQLSVSALQTRLSDLRTKLARAEARDEGTSFKRHTKMQADITAVEQVLKAKGVTEKKPAPSPPDDDDSDEKGSDAEL